MRFEVRKNMPVKHFNKHWQFCVGSGEASLALRTDYVRQLKQVHDELGIRYVRFHGIFDDNMNVVTSLQKILGTDGGREILEYNFQTIGLAYDNVLSCGMKPFVELSFMPSLLAKNDDRTMFYNRFHISPPGSYETWADFIRCFIRFLLHRYGEEEVESWYFEVWNEPDLFNFFSGKKADYYRLYETTARAVKEVDPRLRVGGPATSGSKWVRSFVEFCRKGQVPVDFISTHQYAGDPLGGVEMTEELEQDNMYFDLSGIWRFDLIDALPEGASVLEGYRTQMPDRSEQELLPDDTFVKHAEYVRKEAGNLPLIYTEWNENSTFSAYTNDTRKVAAYDVKTALAVENLIDASSIWCFSDIFDEYHHFKEEFHGGFGLLSNSGIPKPVYYALREMAKLGDERILIENMTETKNEIPIEIAAFRKSNEIQIVLYRLCMKQIDSPKETAEVSVELSAPPVSVRCVRIDEDHGNPLKYWEEKGRPEYLNPAEVREIINETEARGEELPFAYQDGNLVVSAELGINDLAFITIRAAEN